MRTSIIILLQDCVYCETRIMSATQIAVHLNPAKLASVSSLLKKMTNDSTLLRVKGFGKRGGYGYMINPNHA